MHGRAHSRRRYFVLHQICAGVALGLSYRLCGLPVVPQTTAGVRRYGLACTVGASGPPGNDLWAFKLARLASIPPNLGVDRF